MTTSRRSSAVTIAWLELRLVLRSRTTRFLVLVFPVFAAAAAIGVLLMPGYVDYDDYVFLVSVYNPLTYLALAISWNATHADGLFGVPIASASHVEGRLLAAAVMAAPVALLLTIEVVLLKPEMVLLPAASVAFALVVTALPFIVASVRYPRSVDADAAPLGDLGRFGISHYVCVFAVIVPVWLTGKFVSTAELVTVLVGAALVALIAYPFVLRWAAAELTSQVPACCETFRRA